MTYTEPFKLDSQHHAVIQDLRIFITYCHDSRPEHRELYLALINAIDPLRQDLLQLGRAALNRLDA